MNEDNNMDQGGQNPSDSYSTQHESSPSQPQHNAPYYDEFMYQPIGFEELEKTDLNVPEAPQKRKNSYSAAVILFFIILIAAIALSCVGIAFDIFNSKKGIAAIASRQNVVLYSSSKPEGAEDVIDAVDENGRYTPEGAAAKVIDSIVEIYTYSDSSHSELVGTGSGIILTADGYIATNAHVLQSDGYHIVKTRDSQTLEAKIVGRDIKTDIAVIKVTGNSLKPAVLGDSDETIVGEQVLAIGNPAGLSSSVTDGIVSYVNRPIRSDSTGFEMECIQTNAQISPGNSGGALVNMYGQVIGITSSKYVSTNLEGLGFAITINEAKPLIEELIDKGYVEGRFRVGIELIGMSNETQIAAIEAELGFALPDDFKGIYIAFISEDADIANTDLVPGDFITAVNGKTVSTYSDFYDTVSSMYGAGDTVPATCAHLEKDGKITYYDIEFKLMEDTSGNY